MTPDLSTMPFSSQRTIYSLLCRSFPPKNAKTNIDKEKLPSMSTAAQAFFPSTTLAQSEIWDEEIRHPLRKPKFKKKDIDARRSKVCDLFRRCCKNISYGF